MKRFFQEGDSFESGSKIIFLIFVIAINICSFAHAEEFRSITGVIFKDGMIVRGKIIQMNADTVTILSDDGQTVTRKFNDVERFLKEGSAQKQIRQQVQPQQQETQQVQTLGRPRFYVALGGGGGGDAGTGNMRIETGLYSADKKVNYLLAIGFPLTLGRDDTPSGLLDYPVPHSNYTNLGTKRKGEEVGLYAKLGFEPIRGTGIFLFGTGGFTSGGEINLARSNVTGWYYQQSSSTTTYGLIGGGLGYFPRNHWFSLQIAYDNRMGINGLLGLVW